LGTKAAMMAGIKPFGVTGGVIGGGDLAFRIGLELRSTCQESALLYPARSARADAQLPPQGGSSETGEGFDGSILEGAANRAKVQLVYNRVS